MNLFTDFPALQVYAVASAIVALNMIVLAGMTGAARAKTKSFNNHEDAGGAALDKDDPKVTRLKRAHQNAIESAIMFYPFALLYAFASPTDLGAKAYFFTYAGARVLHTIVYLNEKQPWRTILYVIGTLSIVGMMVHVLRVALGF